MSITRILKSSYNVAKSNPQLFIPLLVASVFGIVFSLITVGSTIPMLSGIVADPGSTSAEQMLTGIGTAVGGAFVVSLISAIVYLLAHGMTVAMANQALKGERPSLADGWSRLMSRLVAIIIASILVGLLVGIGTLLLVLPGIVVGFLLMFTLISVIVDDANAFQAIGHSIRTASGHFGATFVLFLVLIALGLIAGAVGAVVGFIPFLGVILTMIVSALYTGYVTIFMLSAYHEIHASPGDAPEEAQA